MGTDIKIELLKLHKTQRWLVEEVRKRGYSRMDATRLSSILTGTYIGGDALEVLKLCEQMVEDEKTGRKEAI